MNRKIFWETQETLDNIIEDNINYIEKEFYPNIEKLYSHIDPKRILYAQNRFRDQILNSIPEDIIKSLCGGEKDNRRSSYNILNLLMRAKRAIILYDKSSTFTNFIEYFKYLPNYLNNPTNLKIKYPYYIIVMFDNKPYEIPMIKIVEAYATLIINGLRDIKILPIRNRKFINEFSISLNLYPKGGKDDIYVMGIENKGDFGIESSSPISKIQKLRKIYLKGTYYFPMEIQRRELLYLYYHNLLNYIFKKESFYMIVPSKELLSIYFNILKSSIDNHSHVRIPMIFTYLALYTEIIKRRKKDLDSFFITDIFYNR